MTESDHQTLQGRRVTLDGAADAAEAIEEAFDYRGDVTLETRDGRTIEGYLFDRRKDGDKPHVRLLTADGERIHVDYAEIATLAFTGRDTAAGKSWETWVKKYKEKKARGEEATINPEKLD